MRLKLEITEEEVINEMAFVIFTDMLVKLKSPNYVTISDDGEKIPLFEDYDEYDNPTLAYSFINLSEEEKKKRQKEMCKIIKQGIKNKDFFQTRNLIYFEISSTANVGGIAYKDEEQNSYPVLYDKYSGQAEVWIGDQIYEYSLIHHFILAEADTYTNFMVELEDSSLDSGGNEVC